MYVCGRFQYFQTSGSINNKLVEVKTDKYQVVENNSEVSCLSVQEYASKLLRSYPEKTFKLVQSFPSKSSESSRILFCTGLGLIPYAHFLIILWFKTLKRKHRSVLMLLQGIIVDISN